LGIGNGSLVSGTPQGKAGTAGILVSARDHADFGLRAQFWADEDCNCGIFVPPPRSTQAHLYDDELLEPPARSLMACLAMTAMILAALCVSFRLGLRAHPFTAPGLPTFGAQNPPPAASPPQTPAITPTPAAPENHSRW
jgi:hypothetical protein